MKKEAAIAIFFGLMMIFSTAGFAILSSTRTSVTGGEEQQEIPSFTNTPFDRQEVILLLRNGRTVIEHGYLESCTQCAQDDSVLFEFSERFPTFVTISAYTVPQENQTVFQMVGQGGAIVELEHGITEESLLEIFCTAAVRQPSECLLRDISTPSQQPTETPGTNESALEEHS